MELPQWFEVLARELPQGLVVHIIGSRFSLEARPYDRCVILRLLIVGHVDVSLSWDVMLSLIIGCPWQIVPCSCVTLW